MAARKTAPRRFRVVACEKTGDHFRGVQLTAKCRTGTTARNCQTCTEKFRFDVRLPWAGLVLVSTSLCQFALKTGQ
ncbi:MAG: hypothetical protein DWQ34_16230 [Planctomycetota bacterium]|nr:MAG: hypothetical protein DWQ34_16230 [Planctomycetota bacterium]